MDFLQFETKMLVLRRCKCKEGVFMLQNELLWLMSDKVDAFFLMFQILLVVTEHSGFPYVTRRSESKCQKAEW